MAVAMLIAASTLPFVSRSGDVSPPAVAARANAATGSTHWVLAVGVSRYLDPSLDLAFADADARAVADTLAEQRGRRVYDRVESRLLVNEEVSRESILGNIRAFIEKAGADDVATIFVAGHGVRDLLTGTYYFLPHDATPDDFFTKGLRVEEFNDMVRILQRHVRHVVVVLDTCHAGAVDLQAGQMARADDFAARVRADGVFLLAATRPGDKSKEVRRLGHGVFTYALLNALRGEANAGADGLLSLAELVIYLGAEVPRLTDGEQTPYYLIAGSDVVFADVRQPNSVVVFPFQNQDRHSPDNDWMRAALQESFYFELAKVPVLHLCPLPERPTEPAPLRTRAQRLGCGKFVTGSFIVDGDEVEMRARVVDTATDSDEATASVRGPRADFAALEKKLVRELLAAMPTVRAYRLMLEALGIGAGEGDAENGAQDAPPPEASDDDRGSWWRPRLSFVAVAFAEETALAGTPVPADEPIRALLREYEAAHDAKQIERIAALWIRFSAKQHEAMRRYFDHARDLTLELADVTIEPHAEEATVALTHIARFVDRESGKPVRLEVRQRMLLVRNSGTWKIERIESR